MGGHIWLVFTATEWVNDVEHSEIRNSETPYKYPCRCYIKWMQNYKRERGTDKIGVRQVVLGILMMADLNILHHDGLMHRKTKPERKGISGFCKSTFCIKIEKARPCWLELISAICFCIFQREGFHWRRETLYNDIACFWNSSELYRCLWICPHSLVSCFTWESP